MAAVTGKLLTQVISLNSNPRLTPSSHYQHGYTRSAAPSIIRFRGTVSALPLITVATFSVLGLRNNPNIILPHKETLRNTHFLFYNSTKKFFHRVYMPRQIPAPEGTALSVTVDSYFTNIFTTTNTSRALTYSVNGFVKEINAAASTAKHTVLINELYMNDLTAAVIRFLSAERIINSYCDPILADEFISTRQTLTSNSYLDDILTTSSYSAAKQVILDSYFNNVQHNIHTIFTSCAIVNAYINEITSRTGFGNSVIEYLLSELSELSHQINTCALSYRVHDSTMSSLVSNVLQYKARHTVLNSYVANHDSQMSTVRQSIIANQLYMNPIQSNVLRRANAIRHVQNSINTIHHELIHSKIIQTSTVSYLHQIIHSLNASGMSQRILNSMIRPVLIHCMRRGEAIRNVDSELFDILNDMHVSAMGNRIVDLYSNQYGHELTTWVPPNLRKRLFIFDDVLNSRIIASQAIPTQVSVSLQAREIRNLVQPFIGIVLGPLLHNRIEVIDLKDYQLGNSIRFTATFKNWNGTLTDPVTASFKITGTGDITIFEADVTIDNRLSPGTYFIDYVPTTVGNFTYKWSAQIDNSPAVKMGDFSIKKKIT